METGTIFNDQNQIKAFNDRLANHTNLGNLKTVYEPIVSKLFAIGKEESILRVSEIGAFECLPPWKIFEHLQEIEKLGLLRTLDLAGDGDEFYISLKIFK